MSVSGQNGQSVITKTLLDTIYYKDAGALGTAEYIGTPDNPCGSAVDVLAICALRNIQKIHIANGSTFVVPDDLTERYTFVGEGTRELSFSAVARPRLNFNGKTISYATAIGVNVYDSVGTATGEVYLIDCSFAGTTNLIVTMLRGTISSCTTNGLNLYGTYLYNNLTITQAVGGGVAWNFNNVCGKMTLAGNAAGGPNPSFYGCHDLVLTVTGTGGEVYIYGQAKIIDLSGGAVSVFQCSGLQQAEVPININAIAASETNVFELQPTGLYLRYKVEKLLLKIADPGADTVNIKLYELVNNVLTNTKTVPVTTPASTYYNLMDLFNIPNLVGDNLKITVQATGGGPYAVTGSYVITSI